MKVLVTGATGQIGKALVPLLQGAGHEVVRLSRTPGPGTVTWDPAAGRLAAAALAGIEGVIHLAGEPLLGRWSESKKRAILESRTQGTALLARTLAELHPRPSVLVSASGMSWYGLRRPEVVTEASAAQNDGFLPEVAAAWESSTAPAAAAGIRVVLARISVVLMAEGGMLGQLLGPFKAGLGGPVGDGRMRVTWISRQDVARALLFALETPGIDGPLNLGSPEVVTNRQFAEALGQVLHRPAVLPAPAFAVKLAFGQMAEETIFSDLAMHPQELLAHGFRFLHPDLKTALRAELGLPLSPSAS